MKFLSVVFAIILVVQLAGVTASKLPFNDLIETYGEQKNLATVETNSLLERRNCNTWCLSFCRNRIADILSFAEPTEAYEEQQHIKNSHVKIAIEEVKSPLSARNCRTWCLGWCRN